MGKKKKSSSTNIGPPVPEESGTENEENEGTEALTSAESAIQMVARHSSELKALKKEILALQQSVAKGDKNAKKQVSEQVKRMEQALLDRHKQELDNEPVIELDDDDEVSDLAQSVDDASIDDASSSSSGPRISRQQRRKASKAHKEQEREKELLEMKKNVVDHRTLELQALSEKLAALQLSIREVGADGNCLYYAVADQLSLHGQYAGKDSFRTLRELASSYMRSHADDFMPFLDSEDEMTPDKFERFCDRIRDTNDWGGQLELQALAHALKSPIVIFTAERPSIEMGQEYKNPKIRLSYHRHAYSLGEHYNSVVPAAGS
eukprot:TRINITY_DN15711_c0_g1_i1.p1 TRINITY_DN15711_c0_g1~~TRINITY_DN15711_c0_g1_i1.p1  ORF type:complete len:321 (-),score=58.66 TRINITY_DN15711_c0_g1_i1:81-1043(-)